MAKQPAKNIDLTVNSVVLEDDMTGITLDVTQELPMVTSFSDAGPRRLAGNYDWKSTIDGNADVAASQSDATLFGLLGSAGVTYDFETTGAAAGTDAPNYEGTVLLESYSLSAQVGGALTFKASLAGGSALTRSVA